MVQQFQPAGRQGQPTPGSFEQNNAQFFFNLQAANGEKILTSELYTTKAAALNGIESVKVNSLIDSGYERLDDKANKPRFNLKAANAQVIGVSENVVGGEIDLQSQSRKVPGIHDVLTHRIAWSPARTSPRGQNTVVV